MFVFSIILAIICVSFSTLYLYYKYMYRFWGKCGIKHTNPSFPFGDLSGLGQSNGSMGELLTKVYKQFSNEPYVGTWFFCKPNLLIRDPELIKTVLVRDFMNFHDRAMQVNEKDDPLTGHLFSLSGTKWRNLRVRLTPTFTSGKMKFMFPILVKCCKQLESVLDELSQKEEVIDMKEYSARYTTDVISLCAFGIETDSLHNPDNEFRYYGKKIFTGSIKRMILVFFSTIFPETAKFFKILQIEPDVTEFFLRTLRDNINHRKVNKIKGNDFLDLLIQLMEKGHLDDVDESDENCRKEEFTFEQAAAQTFVFFVAGFETSSTAMQFCLYELALNPEIQNKAREEINLVLNRHDGEFTYESLSEMRYLTCVLEETLRIFPPLPFIQRECNTDYKIPGSNHVLPKNTQILVDVFGLHHDSKYYDNPTIFNPDRFSEEEKAKRHNYVYLPFGEGPRNCIGMRFALMQAKLGLATLLKNYKFSVTPETPIPLNFNPKSFILSPIDGMKLRVSKVTK